MVVLLIIGANDLLMGELGEIWDRVTDPDFDPAAPEQTTYFESLEVDLSLVNFVPIVLGSARPLDREQHHAGGRLTRRDK